MNQNGPPGAANTGRANDPRTNPAKDGRKIMTTVQQHPTPDDGRRPVTLTQALDALDQWATQAAQNAAAAAQGAGDTFDYAHGLADGYSDAAAAVAAIVAGLRTRTGADL